MAVRPYIAAALVAIPSIRGVAAACANACSRLLHAHELTHALTHTERAQRAEASPAPGRDFGSNLLKCYSSRWAPNLLKSATWLLAPSNVLKCAPGGGDSQKGLHFTKRSSLGRPKVGLGIYIYSCHAGELFGFVPVARDEQAFSC